VWRPPHCHYGSINVLLRLRVNALLIGTADSSHEKASASITCQAIATLQKSPDPKIRYILNQVISLKVEDAACQEMVSEIPAFELRSLSQSRRLAKNIR
jgi:hypothetical protein